MRISDWSSDVCSSDLKAADEQNVVGISGERAVPGGIYVQGGVLIDDSTGQRIEAIDLKEIASLPGVHNGQNAAAAYAACKAVGVDPAVICACLRSFPGRSEEHTSELQSLMRTSSAVFCLKKNTQP